MREDTKKAIVQALRERSAEELTRGKRVPEGAPFYHLFPAEIHPIPQGVNTPGSIKTPEAHGDEVDKRQNRQDSWRDKPTLRKQWM